MEASIENLCERIPCRRSQIEFFSSLVQKKNFTCPGLFLYGHTATGKSQVTNAVLKSYKIPYVTVNCVECYSSRLLYEHIIDHLSNHVPSPDNNFTSYARCDNMNDFIRLLKQVLVEQGHHQEGICIVIDKAERLRDMDPNLLPALLKLPKLTNCNIHVILMSEIVWEKLRSDTGSDEPIQINFPDYSKDELIEIMALDSPKDYLQAFYKNYINLLLSVFYLACRDLNELRHLALLNFPKYIEPIKNEQASPEDTRKLWKNIEPHLKKALQTVYLREVSSVQWEKMQEAETDLLSPTKVQGLSCRANVELPYYSKYLLVASYLASYNPASSDKRFFAKHSGKVNKRALLAASKKHERTSNQFLGPKAFPMDRLMAIFYSILEGKVAPTANIFSQISSLVTLGLITHASADQLDSPKYKCIVSLDFIRGIGRSVGFDVVKYLYDFVQ